MNINNMDEQKTKNWHDKNYKKLLLIPLALLVFSFIYLGIFYSNTGDSGFDLRAHIPEPVTIKPLERKLIQTGLKFQLSENRN